MVGSSLRNALHRRNHKERAQHTSRSRLGLLEKKRDYVQRAKDYHSKQDRIHRLQEKAAMRNKDEFYFSMINSRTEKGVHVQDRGNASIPVDTVKLLKSQDENYIRTMRAAGIKRIAVLKLELSNLINLFPPPHALGATEFKALSEDELGSLRSVGLISSSPSGPSPASHKNGPKDNSVQAKGTHVIFVNNPDEAKKYCPPASLLTTLQTPDISEKDVVDLGWKFSGGVSSASTKQKRKGMHVKAGPLPHSHTRSKPQEDAPEPLAIAMANRKLLISELSARLERDALLKDALLEIQNQRLRMQNGSKRLIDAASSVADRSHGDEKGIFFNTNAEDDNEDSNEDSSGRMPSKEQGQWRPKVYKWKFQRKR